MGSQRLRQFIENAEPFGGKAAPNAFALAYPLTRGFCFPILTGAFILRRRTLYPTPGPWIDCGLAFKSASAIKNYPGFAHAASQGYQYTVAVTDGNGYLSHHYEPTRVDFDAEGDLITPALPAWPLEMRAVPIEDGAFRIHWIYDPYGQGAAPTDFEVYEGDDEESIDYNTPLGTADYVANVRAYSYETEGYDDATPKAFAVRARNSEEVAEKNTYTTSVVVARATGPADGAIRSITPTERIYADRSA